MQNTQESVPQTNILSEKLFLGIKWLIFGTILWFLFQTFQHKLLNTNKLIQEFEKTFSWSNAISFLLLFILIFVNWGLEAKKWQILASKFEVLTLKNAFYGVLVGLCLGFITPFNIGDFAGRILKLKTKSKTESIGAILLGNGIQFYVSLIFGTIAYLILWRIQFSIFDQIIFGLLTFMLILGIVIYFKKKQILQNTYRFLWIKVIRKYLTAIIDFNDTIISRTFIWSIFRYITFSLQYLIVLRIFGLNINLLDLWAITSLIFLYKTIIPTINFFTDLGIREYSALHFFSTFSVNTSSIIVATFFLWLINILVPVLLGSILFLRLKNTK